VTARADDLHNPVQDFKIFGWRYPAQGFPVNHYPILKKLFGGGINQQLSSCSEAAFDLGCAFYPTFISRHFMPNQCSVFQFDFGSFLCHITPP
jgi:hypothetical protein